MILAVCASLDDIAAVDVPAFIRFVRHQAGRRPIYVGHSQGGLTAIMSTLPMRPEVQVHAETMRELGDSFELEVRPAVLEVEGKTITLTGSVDEQFEQWQGLLRDIYTTETGLPAVDAAQADTGD